MVQKSRNTRRPSNTISKSSGTSTESPQSESPESEQEFSETSTVEPTTSSPSTLSEDEENDALFAEADAVAAQEAAESDADDESDDESGEVVGGRESAAEAAEDEYESAVHVSGLNPDTFDTDVVDFKTPTFAFKGFINGNVIVLATDAYEEVAYPGSSRKGLILKFHKGQVITLSTYQQYIVKEA